VTQVALLYSDCYETVDQYALACATNFVITSVLSVSLGQYYEIQSISQNTEHLLN